ncbi:MAG: Maf family nucleotide pyrophosphatase [Moheibacter sp.]
MLRDLLYTKKILLASQSPRRQELMKGLGIDFEVVKIETDESFPENLKREEITEFISNAKSAAFRDLKEGEILVTADTLVWLDNEILGKPNNYEDAVRMLEQLSDSTHEVLTSVTLRSTYRSVSFSETTEVHFDPISEEEIHFYLTTYKPFDKAGAYGIQDWLGYAKISRINGCYYNVMGLPLRKLYLELLKF